MINKRNKIQLKQQQQLEQLDNERQEEKHTKGNLHLQPQDLQQQQQTRLRIFVKRKKQQHNHLRQLQFLWLKKVPSYFKYNSTLLLLSQLFALTLLSNMPATTSADWLMDCGDCHCKWNSGKKTADCKNLTLTSVPENLSNEIQVLDLSLNKIVYLEENSFLNADLTNLHKLYIRNSTLEQIDPKSFTQLEILIELDLSNNKLRLLKANLFIRLVKVRAIILNGNQLETLADGIFQNLKYLHKIELKDNLLVKIATQVFVNVPLLSQIYLNNNRLSFLRKESFESVKRLTALSLDGNPWNCTCELQVFRDFVLRRNLYTPPTACYYPSHLRGMLWIEDQPEAFACKPRIIFPAKGASINTSKENVTLVCRVHASANTHISWDYGSKAMYKSATGQLPAQQQLQQRIHIQIIQDDQTKEKEFGRNLFISRLTIVGAEKSDEGTYTCLAENAGGKDAVQMSLLVQKPGARDMLQGNLAAVISLMALGLLSVSVFLAMVTCCIYKRFLASASAHQHRHHHLDLSGNDPLTAHGTVVANHGTTTVAGNTDVMLGVVNGVNDDTLKYKKHHFQQTSINGGTTLIKDKYSELLKHNGGVGGVGGGGCGVGIGDSLGSGNSPLMDQGGGGGGNQNCDVQLGHMENMYYEQSNEDMLHKKYPHGRALAQLNAATATTAGQQTKSRSCNIDGKFNNVSGTVEFQPDLLPAYAGNKINNSDSNKQHQKQQEEHLYSPVITPGSITTTSTINMMEDQHQQQHYQPHLVISNNSTLPVNLSARSKYNTSAQEYLQARFGTASKKQTKSQEKLTSKRDVVPSVTTLTTGSSSLTTMRSSPITDVVQMANRQTKSLFVPQRTVCCATTTITTPTDSTASYEYRQPPPPPYNANHRTAGNLLLTRRTSLQQYDNTEDNNKNSNTKDQGYREAGSGAPVAITLYETARQTIVTASPSMNFPTTIAGYNTNTASPRRQLL